MKRIRCSRRPLPSHTCIIPPKKMTQLLGSRLPRTKEVPLRAGGCTAARFSKLRQRQAAILVRGLCVPTVPHGPSGTAGLLQLPPLLQVVQVGFGACMSWRKMQTEGLICGIWRRKELNPPHRVDHPLFPASRTIHNVNSQTLPWLFLWTLPGQTNRAQKRIKLPNLLRKN